MKTHILHQANIKVSPPKKESNGKLEAPKGHPKWEREEPEPTGSVEYVKFTKVLGSFAQGSKRPCQKISQLCRVL